MNNCPFCDDTRATVSATAHHPGHRITCRACGAQGPIRSTANGAKYAWNKRPTLNKDPLVTIFIKPRRIDVFSSHHFSSFPIINLPEVEVLNQALNWAQEIADKVEIQDERTKKGLS